jgi:sialic acid synthase SpsE
MQMKLGSKLCGPGCPPLLIVEEGQANEGNMQIALRMIEIAAGVGADGIEFQLSIADDLYVRNDPGHTLYVPRQLGEQQIKTLVDAAHAAGLFFQAACLTPRLHEPCRRVGADVFTVNAMDLNNPLMLQSVARMGLPFWLATLMGTMEEIEWAVKLVRPLAQAPFGLLHGQHIMTSNPAETVAAEMLQLDCIRLFQERYGVPVGFVDHTSTTTVPALAVSKGAAAVCKHLAPEAGWRGPDWMVALPPDDWRRAGELARFAARAGGQSKDLSQAEVKDRSVQRRSVFSARALPVGHLLVAEDLVALRPGGGLDPRHMDSLLGRRLKTSVPAQHKLSATDLEA